MNPSKPELTPKIFVKREDIRCVIRFDTLENLQNAILVYGRNSHDAQLDANVTSVMLKKNGKSYKTSWDEANGKSFITEAEIKNDGFYYLDIHGAWAPIGKQIELAEQLNAPIGFARSWLREKFPSKEERFKIPLSEIEKIYEAVGKKFDAKAFMELLVVSKSYRGQAYTDISPVVVSSGDGYYITVGLSSPVDHFEYRKKDNNQYRIEDGFLTGPNKANDGFGLCVELETSVAPISGITFDKKVNDITFDKKLETRILACADKIEAALKGQPVPAAAAEPQTPGL